MYVGLHLKYPLLSILRHFFIQFSTRVTFRRISLKINRWIKGRHNYMGAMSGLVEGMSNFNTAGLGCLKFALSSFGNIVTVLGTF